MGAVARLEASSERHATQMESLAKISMETTAIVTALSGEVRMLWREVGNVSKRIESLETETQRLSEGFLDASQGARTNQQNLGQVALLLVEFSGNHTDRFDRIESRLDKLERKAG